MYREKWRRSVAQLRRDCEKIWWRNTFLGFGRDEGSRWGVLCSETSWNGEVEWERGVALSVMVWLWVWWSQNIPSLCFSWAVWERREISCDVPSLSAYLEPCEKAMREAWNRLWRETGVKLILTVYWKSNQSQPLDKKSDIFGREKIIWGEIWAVGLTQMDLSRR